MQERHRQFFRPAAYVLERRVVRKIMSKIFASDGKVLSGLSRFFDVLILSMLFMVCCVPVITIGPALSALYHTSRKVIAGKKGYLIREYFHSLKINFLSGLFAWVILFLVMALMFVNIFWVATSMSGAVAVVVMALYFFILIAALILTEYVFPILSRFQCKGKQLFYNAMIMAVTNPRQTLCLLAVGILFYAAIVFSLAAFPVLIFFLPTGYGVLQSILLEKIFAAYIDETKDDGRHQRR